MPVPPPFPTLGLIDTGASQSAIHPLVMRSLGLISLSRSSLIIPGHTAVNVAAYDVRLGLGHPPLPQPPIELQVVSIAPANRSVFVIIGRDVLARGALLYDGENQAFSLWP